MTSRAFPAVTPVPTEFIKTNTPGCFLAARMTSIRCGYSIGSPPLSWSSSMPSAAASSIVRSAMSRGMWPGFGRRAPGPAASGRVFFRSATMSR